MNIASITMGHTMIRQSRVKKLANRSSAKATKNIKPSQEMKKRLLIFCPLSIGGVAKNAIEQARALSNQSVDVTLLCPSDWKEDSEALGSIVISSVLIAPPQNGSRSRIVSRLSLLRSILKNLRILESTIRQQQFTHVLFSTYLEYLAPVWAGRFRRLQKEGVIFGSMVLDPVRDYQVGPLWWHRLSISHGYSFLSEAFVHQEIELDTVKPMPSLTTTTVPHGPYYYPTPTISRKEIREEFELKEDAEVFLSFGHLRDNKNLDLILKAVSQVDDIYLLVAGSEASPGQRQSEYYKRLARELGLESRIRWVTQYIDDLEVMRYFIAADFAILAYADSFRSASGILHIAAPLELPILVSCGPSALGALVEDYNLGHRFSLDGANSISDGIKKIRSSNELRRWAEFENDHSYKRNAEIVIDRLW
jgi:glycosyltransferase involved in cell wall biosynthesis